MLMSWHKDNHLNGKQVKKIHRNQKDVGMASGKQSMDSITAPYIVTQSSLHK